jgi:ketosteroid isomerase-like protein
MAVAPDTLSPLHHVQAIFAAFDAKDVGALAALMTDDVRLQIGNADVAAVIAELRVHYTRLDGTEMTLPCCNVFRLRNGAVADYRVYMDITPVYT